MEHFQPRAAILKCEFSVLFSRLLLALRSLQLISHCRLVLRVDNLLMIAMKEAHMTVARAMKQIEARVLADYILKHHGPMSHLKLQKLLYYCQAYHLAQFNGIPLVNENFQAWVHGPVCVEVFHALKDKSLLYSDLGYVDEGEDPDVHVKNLTEDQRELIDDVLESLAKWTGGQLESATHAEKPWIDARVGFGPGDACSNIIDRNLMMTYYMSEINGEN